MAEQNDYDQLIAVFDTYDEAKIRGACRHRNINSYGKNGDTVLITAVREYHYMAVENLLERAVDVNLPGEFGITALMWAAINNDVKMIELLCSTKRLNKEARDPDGWNALDFAKCHYSHDAARFLTSKGLTAHKVFTS